MKFLLPLNQRLEVATAIRVFSLAVALSYYYVIARRKSTEALVVFLAFIFTGVLGSIVISFIEFKM